MKLPNLESIKLQVYNLPIFTIARSRDIIKYGHRNTYPAYLCDLFNQSTVHNAIVTSKVNYCLGKGFKENEFTAIPPNKYESWDSLDFKLFLDLLLYNGMAIEIHKDNKGNITELYHLDFGKLRLTLDKKNLKFSNEWTYINEDGERIEKQLPKLINLPIYYTGTKERKSVMYWTGYRPDFDSYPLPDYVGALTSIETSVEIANWHLNNLKNGFSAGTLISLNNGTIDDPEKRKEVIKDLKAKATGTNRTGEIFVSFSEGKEFAPEILPMQPNNLDKQFEQLTQDVRDSIFIGHKVTNPQMMGVLVGGSLGGREQIAESYELFKETVILPYQKTFCGVIGDLLSDKFGTKVELEIEELKPIGELLPISEQTILQYVDRTVIQDYIYSRYGLTKPEIDPNLPQNLAKNSKKKAKILDYLMSKAIDVSDSELKSEHPVTFEGEKDIHKYNSVMDVNLADDLTDEESKVLKVIVDAPSTTPEYISKITEIKKEEVVKIIGTLRDKFYITKDFAPTKKGVDVNDKGKIVLVYKYAVRPDVPNGKSREFCQKMMELSNQGKRWLREDIEGMKNEMEIGFLNNTNVWKYRGGWYRNPNMEVAVPFCRHVFVQELRIKK
jgi:hypothetical protein